MSKKTRYLLGILLTIIVGTYFYWKICCQCEKKKCCKKGAVEEVVSARGNGFNVASDAGAGLNYGVNDNYNFNTSGSAILQPISGQVTEGVSKVKAFLEANPNQQLSIVGHYRSSEENNSVFPDLGLARANAVKNHMVSMGVSAKSLFTKSVLDDEFAMSNDTLFGPVSFSMDAASSEGTDWEALGAKIKADPLVLYFQTAQASISLTAAQKQKVADISNYLDHVDGAKCLVVGHTDSEGSRATNTRLGQERADFAKTYLVNNGIDGTNIVSSSKGPDQPVADNATEAGRAKNRRTEVTIN